MSAWVFKLWFIICGAAETYFAKREKRDRPAGRSRSHDVFETGELYSQVRKFRTLPHQEGEYLDGTSGSRDAREEKARDPRESCLSAGEEKLRAEGFRCYRAAQEGENLGPNLGELFLAREEKTLAENSGELSVTGPAGRKTHRTLARGQPGPENRPSSHSLGASPECPALLLM